MPPRKPSSGAPSPTLRPTGYERPWCTKRLQSHLKPGRRRSHSSPTIKTHAAIRNVRPFVNPAGDPTVHRGAANWITDRKDDRVSTSSGSSSSPLGVLTTRKCWRSLGPSSRPLGTGLINTNNRTANPTDQAGYISQAQ